MVLIVGGAVTISFTYLFGMRTLRLHVLTVVALTVVLSAILYTIRAREAIRWRGTGETEAFDLVFDKIETGGGR